MAKRSGFHYWFIVPSVFAFCAASAAAAQAEDLFDLFLKQPRTKDAHQAESTRRPHSNSQVALGHEGNSIFGLFIPDQESLAESPTPPHVKFQARAPAKSFDFPKAGPNRDTPHTPRLAVIVKPRPVFAVPKPSLPKPLSKPAPASLVKPKPRPVARKYDCEQARAIIGKYAFGNVQAKSCEGEVYSFAAERLGKPFLVKISALNGELVEVRKASD